jgi:hypothetical protein
LPLSRHEDRGPPDHLEELMLKMNYWGMKWDLHVNVCPCDVHFNEWVEARKLAAKTIYHFGTGTHHVVGIRQAELGNRVFGITASKEEYESYVALVTENARVAKSYLAYFGDIYLSNARLLPDFDVVTLFHLCEFFQENTTSAEYGGITDRALLDLLTDKTRVGGHILFYAIEAGRGRPVSQNAQKWGMRIGLSLVLALMIFTTINDVVRLSAS